MTRTQDALHLLHTARELVDAALDLIELDIDEMNTSGMRRARNATTVRPTKLVRARAHRALRGLR